MSAENLTIVDIAREAGVSSATVSRVLSKHPNVRQATSEKVKAIVDKYNYKPNSIARGLLQRQSHVLGIILPDVKHPYYASVFSAAQREAASAGYVTQVYRLAYNSTITDDFINQLIERRLDGVLLCGGFVEPTNPNDLPDVLHKLQQYMPIVTICPPIAGLHCVNIYTDLKEGSRKAVRHLRQLGHRRVAFVGATDETRSVGEREAGFTEEMNRLGMEPILQHEHIHTPAMGEVCAQRLLASASASGQPTAAIVVNDLMALGFLKGLRRMGLSVPEDMAVVGCDNQFFSAYTCPPLTTLDLESDENGALATRALISSQGADAAPFTQSREPVLIIRESCGANLRK